MDAGEVSPIFLPEHADFFNELFGDSESENEFEGFSELEDDEQPQNLNFDPESWSDQGEHEPFPLNFTGITGLNMQLPESPTLLEFFELFFKDGDFEEIANQTNLYASQYLSLHGGQLKPNSRLRKWKNTTAPEIKVFIGMVLAMGIVTQSDVKDYWSTDPVTSTPFFPACMPRDRFQILMTFLHLNNNECQVPRGQPGYDPLFKLGRIYTHLYHRFSTVYTPHRQLSFDEGMIPWRGNLSFRVYNPDKPIKYGIKAFMLCDAVNGYVAKLRFYTGKRENSPSEAGATYDLIMEMMRGFYGQGYILYCDNYYTSPALFWDLWQLGVGATGTLRTMRLGVPQAIKDKKLNNKGDTTAMSNGPLRIMKYLDRKYVLLLSTVDKDDNIRTGKQDPRTGIPVTRPHMVVQYDRYMGGVDRADQMMSYHSLLGTVKWWKKIFFHLVSLAVLNSYTIYKEVTTDAIPMSHRVYRKNLIKELVSSAGLPPSKSVGRPASQTLDRLHGRHFPQKLSGSGLKRARPKVCVVCSSAEREMQGLVSGEKRKRPGRETSYFCGQCNVSLCVVPCFELYHTKQEYILAYKRMKSISTDSVVEEIITLIGYEPNELIGKTAYQFHNPLDAVKVGNCHSNLIVKGSSVSKYYRFLGKNCEWVWMQTRATIIYNTKNVPQYVVCMNYIISEEEGERFLMMEQEQDGSQYCPNHFTGVIDLSMPHAKPVDCHTILELNDGHCSDHSDAGYGSSSPYSSRHSGGSPCSVDSGNTKDLRPATRIMDDEETNMSVEAVESEFPMFLQEVTKTINSGVPNDRDVLDFLESLDKDNNAEPENVPNGQLSDVQQLFTDAQDPWNNSSQSCLQMLLTDGVTTSDPISSDPAVSMPLDFSTSNSLNGTMLSGDEVMAPSSNNGPMFACPAATAPPSYPVSNNFANSGISTMTNSDIVTVSNANGNMTNTMENGMMSSPHSQTFSDSCDSQDFNLNSSVNSVNMMENHSNGDILARGHVNVNLGVLDHTYFSGLNGDALPKEITDFCMQYCNTLADNQASALISEYTQNGQTDLSNVMSHYPDTLSQKTVVNSKVLGQNKNSGTIPPISSLSKRQFKNNMAPQGLNNGFSRKNLGTQTPEIIKKRQTCSPRKNGNMTYRAQLQLQQQQKQQLLQQQQQKQKQQQYTKHLNQVQCQNVGQIPVSLAQQPQNYFKQKSQTQQRSPLLLSTTRSSSSSCLSPGGSTSPLISPPSYSKPCSQNNIMSSLQISSAQISDTSKNFVNSCLDSNQPNLQSMSELEKMLRGYISFNGSVRSCGNNVANQQQSIVNSDLSNNSAATLLEKMLTGQLSGAQYHALEKQRTGTSVPISRH